MTKPSLKREREPLSPEVVAARIRGEQARVLGNIMARTGRHPECWWLSFADDNGFRGATIVHAADFVEALMQANLNNCNPHGECQGMGPIDGTRIPEKWKYRILTREECAEFDKEQK